MDLSRDHASRSPSQYDNFILYAGSIRLTTAASAALDWESDRRGTLEAGRLADLAAYRIDPISCPIDDLPQLRPSLTMVGGRAVYDPESLVPPRD